VTPAQLSPIQVDALREVANIGSGYAATSLSQLSGIPIMIDVPSIRVATVADVVSGLVGENDRLVALSTQMLGDLAGHTLYVLPERNACLLCDMMLCRAPGTSGLEGDMERSSLREAGNIMAGSFLNALSAVLGKMLLPSVPSLLIERSDSLRVSVVQGTEEVLVVETSFQCDESGAEPHELTGAFLFILDDEDSINELFHTLTP
jgi:chemotaxis protein CheC